MSNCRAKRQNDLLRLDFDQIIDLGHPLTRLAGEIDSSFINARFSSVRRFGPELPLVDREN